MAKTCIAETSSGEPCEYTAKYPEDDPKYCGIHYNPDDDDDEDSNDDDNNRERYIVYN